MAKIKVEHPITKEVFEMTQDQIEAAYRYQEKEYRKMDAIHMIEERLEWLNGDKEAFKEEYGESFDDTMNDVDYLVECFFDKFDCNYPENEAWAAVFDSYFGHEMEEDL